MDSVGMPRVHSKLEQIPRIFNLLFDKIIPKLFAGICCECKRHIIQAYFDHNYSDDRCEQSNEKQGNLITSDGLSAVLSSMLDWISRNSPINSSTVPNKSLKMGIKFSRNAEEHICLEGKHLLAALNLFLSHA